MVSVHLSGLQMYVFVASFSMTGKAKKHCVALQGAPSPQLLSLGICCCEQIQASTIKFVPLHSRVSVLI